MSNKPVSKKEVISTSVPKLIDKSKKENHPDEIVKKSKKPIKKSSLAQINAAERSAVNAVKPNSSRTVRGSSGLANTGTIISYD